MRDEFDFLGSADLSTFPCLSRGIDSLVYRVGDFVVKEYQRLNQRSVERYAEMQNTAAGALSSEPYRACVDFQGRDTELIADRAVEVLWCGVSRQGLPLTVSPFVEATNLEKLLWKPEMFAKYREREMSDPTLIRFASELNSFFWEEYPTRVQDEFRYHTCMLSRHLDRVLGVSGLYITKYNIKIEPTNNPSILRLVVTDLALYMERVTVMDEIGVETAVFQTRLGAT